MEWSRLLEEMNMVVSGSWDRTLRHWATTCFFSSRFPGVFVRWELQGFWRRFVLVLFFWRDIYVLWDLPKTKNNSNHQDHYLTFLVLFLVRNFSYSTSTLMYFNFGMATSVDCHGPWDRYPSGPSLHLRPPHARHAIRSPWWGGPPRWSR